MKLYYIFHSGFAIETKKTILIIDYFQDSNEEDESKGIVHEKLLKSDKQIYVLSTHVHADHFNPIVLSWKREIPTIRYIFSSDILEAKKAKPQEANYLESGESFKDEFITVEAFGSTDAGVSFLIKVDGKLLFHAGDLNNWHWRDDSIAEESDKTELHYLEELNKIKNRYNALDLVLFPVDQRMKSNYYLGAQQFIESIKTNYFAPMHFTLDYNGANAFEKVAKANNTNFLAIHNRGEEFKLNL